jgi:hypothetical protein
VSQSWVLVLPQVSFGISCRKSELAVQLVRNNSLSHQLINVASNLLKIYIGQSIFY